MDQTFTNLQFSSYIQDTLNETYIHNVTFEYQMCFFSNRYHNTVDQLESVTFIAAMDPILDVIYTHLHQACSDGN